MQFAETHDAWLGRRVCSVARRPEHYTCTCRVSAFGEDVENGDLIVASNGDVGCVEACVNDGASFFLVVRQMVVVEGRRGDIVQDTT